MDTLIIGGGASGIVAAIAAAKKGDSVAVLESSKRICKKLLMTGGGRCNLLNADRNPFAYNNPDFVKRCFEKVTQQRYLDFLNDCGIFLSYPDGEGRIYPITFSANSVCDCLRLYAERLGVKIICQSKAEKIVKDGERFCVIDADGKKYSQDRVVLAVGSGSQALNPNLDQFVDRRFLTAIAPSLTPLSVSNPAKSLNGIRQRGQVFLVQDGEKIASSKGEIHFREFGLSGICVFDLSSFIARQVVKSGEKSKFDLAVDLLPDFDLDWLCQILDKRQKEGYTCDGIFVGLLPNKVAELVTKNAPDASPKSLAYAAKNLIFFDAKLTDYSLSQVTSGGVNVKFLDDKLTLPNGISVCGEALDVDGICGGYNLYFAFLSGIIAGEA